MLAYLLLRTAPTWVSEASVARARTAPRRGWARGTAATRAALAAVIGVSMSGCKGRVLGLPKSAAVSGRSVPAKVVSLPPQRLF